MSLLTLQPPSSSTPLRRLHFGRRDRAWLSARSGKQRCCACPPSPPLVVIKGDPAPDPKDIGTRTCSRGKRRLVASPRTQLLQVACRPLWSMSAVASRETNSFTSYTAVNSWNSTSACAPRVRQAHHELIGAALVSVWQSSRSKWRSRERRQRRGWAVGPARRLHYPRTEDGSSPQECGTRVPGFGWRRSLRRTAALPGPHSGRYGGSAPGCVRGRPCGINTPMR